MPIGENRAFLEETILIDRPETCAKTLQARLMRRLEHRGIRVAQIHEVELCRIPMDAPLPCVPQRGLAFGAAASLIHPATGYMMARAAQLAPQVADALAQGLADGQDGPQVTQRAWGVIWPPQALRAWELYSFGARVLCQMDAATLRQFYQAFFSQPEETWSAYLAWGLTPWQIGQMMWGVYLRCPGAIRRRLRRSAMHQPGPVARGWLGWGAASIAPRQENNPERTRADG
jgi:lycopene beta-cyclase